MDDENQSLSDGEMVIGGAFVALVVVVIASNYNPAVLLVGLVVMAVAVVIAGSVDRHHLEEITRKEIDIQHKNGDGTP